MGFPMFMVRHAVFICLYVQYRLNKNTHPDHDTLKATHNTFEHFYVRNFSGVLDNKLKLKK